MASTVFTLLPVIPREMPPPTGEKLNAISFGFESCFVVDCNVLKRNKRFNVRHYSLIIQKDFRGKSTIFKID